MATQKRIVDCKVNDISDEEKRNNAISAKNLQINKNYRFDPCMNASAIPQAVHLNGLPMLDFRFGTYLGMQDDRLVFEGYPLDAPEKTPEWKFFFFVSCVEGGAKMTPMRKIE